MAHRGIREFDGSELSSVALGQNGFKVLSNDEFECGVDSYSSVIGFPDVTYFVALKAVNADAIVEARSVTEGDDFTTNSGTYNGSSPITIANGDIVYGAFDKVEVASGDYVLAYIGK